MNLLKASLRPSLLQRVSEGTRESGRKLGAWTQDTGLCGSKSNCRSHWTPPTPPTHTHKPSISGEQEEEEARAPPMPGKNSKRWNVHLECSVSQSHFLCSLQLMGSLESHVHCICSPALWRRAKQFVCTKSPAQQAQDRLTHTHAHAHTHTSLMPTHRALMAWSSLLSAGLDYLEPASCGERMWSPA